MAMDNENLPLPMISDKFDDIGKIFTLHAEHVEAILLRQVGEFDMFGRLPCEGLSIPPDSGLYSPLLPVGSAFSFHIYRLSSAQSRHEGEGHYIYISCL